MRSDKDKVNTTDMLHVSAEKKRLLQEITHLEKAQKSGIISKEEVASAKVGIDKKIRALEHKEKQTLAKNKAVEEILGASLVASGKRHTKYFAPLEISKHAASKTEQKKVFKENEKNALPVQDTHATSDLSSSSVSPPLHPEYHAIDELAQEDDTNWRFALAVLTIFLLILLYIKFTSYGAPGDVMTLDAYLDYASLYSHDMHAVLVTLQSEYGEKLWVEYHLIGTTDFHTLAASAISCADAQQRKQEYLGYLFTPENTLATAQEFTAAAETLGLVSADFSACLSAADSQSYLAQQQEYVTLEILYTPTLVVNNKKIVGAVGYDAVKSVLDEQLLQLG